MNTNVFEFRKLTHEFESPLGEFFEKIVSDGDDKIFHPHSFDKETAQKIARYTGMDQYVAVLLNNRIMGYGMLRGWDDGYDIPSLGMIIHPALRGKGVGFSFIKYLHSLAMVCGATTIRLSVYEINQVAIRLYERVGYTFTPEEKGVLIGKWCKGGA